MVHLVVFVNLFFVPLLPLYFIYRIKQKPLAANLDLLFQYGMVVVCNFLLSEVFAFSMEEIVGIIPIDSGYYTVAALLPTILAISAVVLYKFCKTYPDHEPWSKKIGQKGIKGVAKDLAPACILMFTGCFMLFLYEPILMYANNMGDFWFDFHFLIGPVLMLFFGLFLVGIALIFVVYNIDLLISKQLFLYKGITLMGFVAFVLLYLQGNWLVWSLPVLDGDEIVWKGLGKIESLILILAMVILTAAIINSIKKQGLNRTVFYLIPCTSAVFVMLFASLVPTVIANKALLRRDVFSPTVKNYNTISSNKNFLIFLIDNTDAQVFYDVMMEDDDFRGIMDDFTYFPDTLSLYPQTHDSIPNILTGTVYRNETNFMDYSNNAYNQSPLFEKLSQNDYEINLYSTAVFWEGEKNYNIENIHSIYDDSMDKKIYIKQELKYILFKYLPYGLKQFSKIGTLDFDLCRIAKSEYNAHTLNNKVNYKLITENSVLDKQSQNYFQFMHVEGSHQPLNMDKDLNSVKGGTYEQKVGASLTMVKAYLQRLKDNGAYDNSVIVIMSDHGWPYVAGQPKKQLSRCNPALFIKGINEKHEMLESYHPISYVDLQDAFCDLIDGKQSTELFAGLEQGRTRTVYWQTNKTRGHKIEYVTTGKAWELDKFTRTGNIYDLKG